MTAHLHLVVGRVHLQGYPRSAWLARSNRSKRRRPPPLTEQHAELRSVSGAVGAADPIRSSAEGRARRTATTTSSPAHIGTSGLPGGGRHASAGHLGHAANRRTGACFDILKSVIRLLATDLDGTFWGPDLVPPPEHLVAVDELTRRDVTVLAATSRRPRVAKQRLGDVGLTLPAVLIDGAVGIDFRTGEQFHEAAFGAEAARNVLAAFRAHGLDPCLYVDDPGIDIAVSATPSTCVEHLDHLGRFADTRDLDDTVTMMKVYAFSVLGVDQDLLAPLALELDDAHGTTVVLYPEPDYGRFGLIVNPHGVSKWSGIQAFCTLHGIAPDEVAAVGDGLNDLEMLRRARVCVGVRGGSDEVIAMADFLIDPPKRGGWSEIVEILEGQA
jgi:hydroxymethylpyrimidine pyrophosphatase-like HAD family hydrolase